MTDLERERFGLLGRRLRRLAAQCEALACGYVSADAAERGGEEATRRELEGALRSLATERPRKR